MGVSRAVAVAGCCVVAAALPYVAGIWTVPPAFVVLGIGVRLVGRSRLTPNAKFLVLPGVLLGTFALLIGFLALGQWLVKD